MLWFKKKIQTNHNEKKLGERSLSCLHFHINNLLPKVARDIIALELGQMSSIILAIIILGTKVFFYPIGADVISPTSSTTFDHWPNLLNDPNGGFLYIANQFSHLLKSHAYKTENFSHRGSTWSPSLRSTAQDCPCCSSFWDTQKQSQQQKVGSSFPWSVTGFQRLSGPKRTHSLIWNTGKVSLGECPSLTNPSYKSMKNGLSLHWACLPLPGKQARLIRLFFILLITTRLLETE